MSGKKAAKPATWKTADGQVISKAEATRLTEELEADDDARRG